MRHLIIAGSEKSGTTSVYHYLNAHPDVVGSYRKETDYFRREGALSLEGYSRVFPPAQSKAMRMEASPGYLAESERVAPAIASLLPDARLLFILRDPIERVLSSFQFHKSRLFIPEDMLFEDYVNLCLRYDKGEIDAQEAGIDDWFLQVLDAGRYASHLRDYLKYYPLNQIKVLTFDRLQQSAHDFMCHVCAWTGLDDVFYDDFDFTRANVTFAPRYAWLQRIALLVNRIMEPFFNRYPLVKRKLTGTYKLLNARQVSRPAVSRSIVDKLANYYARDVEDLMEIFGEDVAEAHSWLIRNYTGNSRSGKEVFPADKDNG